MRLALLPAAASWRHRDVRVGFEVAFFGGVDLGHRLTGHTTAQESRSLWSVGYDVTVDDRWRTLTALATNVNAAGPQEVSLSRDDDNRWVVDGKRRPELDGCVDVDFESSVVTNTLPIHRLDFIEGAGIDVPAAFVRAGDLRVERLEQRYTLIEVTDKRMLFYYESPIFDFAGQLQYDPVGLIVAYPGIATRAT